jgi:hypothetical protein
VREGFCANAPGLFSGNDPRMRLRMRGGPGRLGRGGKDNAAPQVERTRRRTVPYMAGFIRSSHITRSTECCAMRRIALDCLSCGHRSSLGEGRILTKRTVCTKCRSKARPIG